MSVDATTKDLENLIADSVGSKHPVLVDFHAPWCAPCRAMAPLLEQLVGDMPQLRVVKVNVDDEPDAAVLFQVRSIPTLALIDDGEVTAVKVGALSYAALREWVKTNTSA
jgi:thioredoxin 1